MYDIITIGDATTDIFLKIKDLSLVKSKFLCMDFGGKIDIEEVHYDVGGGAVNVAIGLKRLGFEVGLRTAIGADYFGEKILDRVRDEDLDENLIIKDQNVNTSFALIFTSGSDRSILIYRGIPDYGRLKLPKTKKSKWIFLAPLHKGFEELQNSIIPLLAEKGVKLIFNPGNYQIENGIREVKKMIRLSQIVIINRDEALAIIRPSGVITNQELTKRLLNLGAEVVAVTLGKDGATCATEDIYLYQRAKSVLVKDVTGAGDGFSVGFSARLMKEKGDKRVKGKKWEKKVLSEALNSGLENSVSVIEHLGAT